MIESKDYYDCVILSGAPRNNYGPDFSFVEEQIELLSFFRCPGPVRLRTHLAQHGYRVRAVDFCDFYDDSTMSAILNNLICLKTKILGLSTTFLSETFWNKYRELFLELKSRYPQLKIVVGGYPSIFSDSSDYIDYTISGYAENALLAYLDDNRLTSYNHMDANIDYAYDSTDLTNKWLDEDNIQSHEALPIEIARGCIFKCAFCSFPLKGKKKLDYLRSYDNLRNEFIRNYESFGITNYVFDDDTYNDSSHKLEAVADILSSLPFKINYTCYVKPELLVSFPEQIDLLIDSGLLSANYGLESFNYKTRMSIKKMGDINKVLEKIKLVKDKSRGVINNGITMIAGLPDESIESLEQSHEYLMNSDYIDGTHWGSLHISDKKITSPRKLSPIDENPERYGYRIKQLNNIVYWKNDHMDLKRASKLAVDFNIDNFTYNHLFSFSISMAQNINIDITKKLKYTDIVGSSLDALKSTRKNIINDYVDKILSR